MLTVHNVQSGENRFRSKCTTKGRPFGVGWRARRQHLYNRTKFTIWIDGTGNIATGKLFNNRTIYFCLCENRFHLSIFKLCKFFTVKVK